MLYIVRGLPGSGKSTLANKLVLHHRFVFEADQYFLNEHGDYLFSPKELPKAHASCLQRCEITLNAMRNNVMSAVAVANTFSCRWEMEPYFKLAKKYDVSISVIDLFDQGLTDEELATRCEHGVPSTTIANMRNRWEFDWKNADPSAPWDRK